MTDSEQTSPNVKSNLPAAVNMDGEKGVKTLAVGWNQPVKETMIGKFTKKSHIIKHLQAI